MECRIRGSLEDVAETSLGREHLKLKSRKFALKNLLIAHLLWKEATQLLVSCKGNKTNFNEFFWPLCNEVISTQLDTSNLVKSNRTYSCEWYRKVVGLNRKNISFYLLYLIAFDKFVSVIKSATKFTSTCKK